MNKPGTAIFNMEQLESLSKRDSLIHRLDARAKILVTFAYLIALLSLNSQDIFGMVAFLAYPVIIIALSDIPGGVLFKRALIALPFVLLIGILNPFFDREPVMEIGSLTITGGWLSFIVIIARGVLSVLAALILVATTGIPNISKALKQLKIPAVMTTQLLFVFRYLFLLAEEASSMLLSARLRNSSSRSLPFRVWRNMIGSLLLRSLDRSERIYAALLCRGFQGELTTMGHQTFGKREWLYLLGWCSTFAIIRLCDPVNFVGGMLHSSILS